MMAYWVWYLPLDGEEPLASSLDSLEGIRRTKEPNCRRAALGGRTTSFCRSVGV